VVLSCYFPYRCIMPLCAAAIGPARANSPAVKLAGLQAALGLLCAPTPAIACPPSAAAPEVKALASKEEAAMLALSRWAYQGCSCLKLAHTCLQLGVLIVCCCFPCCEQCEQSKPDHLQG
jgi:hypothetical protein